MRWYQILSAPVAGIYALVSIVRNGLYKTRLLHVSRVSVPTICVGNLAVGGTGKTPFVEYLIRTLQNDYHVAVLSRGYKRKTHGFVLADKTATALTIGDEPIQIHSKFPHIPLAVCADRVHGIHQLQKLYPDIQVVILDDAYQYRRLKCGYYILLTAYDRLYIDDYFLPMGCLRDNKNESMRASAIVVTKCPETMRPIDQRIIDTKLHLPVFQQLCFSRIVYPELPAGKRVLLLTGIAHPEYLIEHVRKTCPSVQTMTYPDHYSFKTRDIQLIAERADSVDVVLTTEKDYMRLKNMKLPPALAKKLRPLPISIEVLDDTNLIRQIHQYINENLHSEK
ncbi:MAG: tetraacyldisaccharide 4'-kinase [Paludibacteraceae bacterium]|nr:tetraacyldisaccharide 4'-kinase [Paludibacteraceae bacterium]